MSQSYVKNLSRPRLVQKPFGFAALRVSNAVPLVLVPDPQADQLIIPLDLVLQFVAGVDYAGALVYTLEYIDGTDIDAFAGVHDVDSLQYWSAAMASAAPEELVDRVGSGVQLTSASDRADGTGTLLVTMTYRVYTLGG